MKISFKFLTYDFWIGMFHDRKKDVIYFNPLPCCVFKIQKNKYHKLSYGEVFIPQHPHFDKILVFKLNDLSVVPKLMKKLDLYYCYMSHKLWVDIHKSNEANMKYLESEENYIRGQNIPDNVVIFITPTILEDIVDKGLNELI